MISACTGVHNVYPMLMILDSHKDICMNHEAVKCVIPHKYIPGEMIMDKYGKQVERPREDIIKFKNDKNKFKHPFHVFMDFEATLEKISPDDEINKSDCKTVKYNKHVANSFGIKYNSIHEEYNEPLKIFNNASQDKLMESMVLEVERLALKSYKLIKQCEANNHKADPYISSCQECGNSFSKSNHRVAHHDHITGEYISTICNTCNLKYQYKKFLPVYLHNLKGYDSHFIVPALNKYGYVNTINDKNISEITCIPNNEEKYISFSKLIKVDTYQKRISKTEFKTVDVMLEIRFVDTFSFMNSSIDKLAGNLKDGCKSTDDRRKVFKNCSDHFKNDNEFDLMISKGIYPYEYMDSYDRMSDTELPSIDKFYSKLYKKDCSPKEYRIAQEVWTQFRCKTMLDYHNIYLSSDVLLLADIWENFRATCYKIYGLDADYYYTAPGLSWDAFLKHTNEQSMKKYKKEFEIGLITDMDIYLFVESGIRGGLSQISKRYAKANNKYIPETYEKNSIDSYIIYLDANNLYGGAMVKYLPQGNFQWNHDTWTNDKILQIKDDASTGYLFDVNIHYPEHLHDLHNGYALAAENITIPTSYLNKWQREVGLTEGGEKIYRKDGTIGKLCTSFHDKMNYPINYRLLKLYIQLGLEIKVNRVLQFDQSDFMKSYIMKNTNERKNAKNDFEKDFYKLMNNSVYGKTMENVRNRINFKLVSSEEEALRCRNQKQKFTMFNQNLVGVHLLKTEVKLNKPIFIGQCVLDDSKYTKQDFHYNFMLKKIKPENVALIFTDTDSLCYHIKNEDPYKVIAANKDKFDLAAYPKNHELYDPTNEKVLDKIKDESINKSGVHYIKEIAALRSKLYAYTQTDDKHDHKRCKGIKKSVIEKDIHFKNYYEALFGKDMNVKMNTFRSYGHQIYTEQITKTALSRNDDKTYILDDFIHCRTFGHYLNK